MSNSPTFALEKQTPVGLQLLIETPENVVLTYQLAGPTVRMLAYLFDVLLRSIVMAGLSIASIPFLAILPGTTAGLLLVAWFALEWGYHAVCEGFFKGKTIGKYVLGLRVIHQEGHPITFWPALLRNVVRVADGLPYLFSGVGFVSMLLTRRFQRLGDLAARTVVVTERRAVLPREPIILEKIRPLAHDQLGSYVPDQNTLTAIEQFLGRRSVLSHRRGHELARSFALPLAKRLNYTDEESQASDYPMAFLARVYVTFLHRDEDDAVADALVQTAGTAHAGSATMNKRQFVQRRQPAWSRFQQLTGNISGIPKGPRAADQITEFSRLFRACPTIWRLSVRAAGDRTSKSI